RAPDFADSTRESALTTGRRAPRHDPLERSELARTATLRLFHRESAIISVVTQTHVHVVTGLCPVTAGAKPRHHTIFRDSGSQAIRAYTRSSTLNSPAPPFHDS